ncbi:NADH dehydrogenase [ubiquinone] 1 beta subcomplex subunit 8, mitochondrial-like [Eriocheir sinensis]|uniref:NADH dehydrogenase [ubiquinone] 1 beta subcomplex subunit 8, mitochondrial-like n=1 Tax=Eriocheir sinensis TaxID=95602 RepID=UPI0021CA00D1|nr:NADH dehydrogenase [ubiquinone] 1 beta subcomplex subunit 8, mitochondrial-like [Eriocheir sinensis]XP_050714416.1 NADH dehydrogenase [ubiquinone] 1 beta subcomplex subunit 8, mitochondrial-like [Eriocheir sinensis]
MARLVRLARSSRQVSGLPGVVFSRSAGNWNKDWKPGPYPVTPEERQAAARKYGLRPDEYQPVPDDGIGAGDYPDVPLVSAESRDPYYQWDYPEHRRDFGEPLHRDFDMYGLDRVDATNTPRFSTTQQFLAFMGVMTFFVGTYYLMDNNKCHWPLLPKQYPGNGKVHYTFEKPE